jgi:hypothetical protein
LKVLRIHIQNELFYIAASKQIALILNLDFLKDLNEAIQPGKAMGLFWGE